MSAASKSRGATAQLAEFAAAIRYEDIPSPVVGHIKRCLLDGLGCGLFGSRLPWAEIVGRFAHAQSPGGTSSIWGSGHRSGPADAALANGTASHGFEIDDIHLRSLIHPGAVTIPAAIAIAETHRSSGRALLTAVVAGYETGLRVGICAGIAHQLRCYHPTGTVGSVGAAATASSLLSLSPTAATHALAIGATRAAGLYSAARTGAMVKRMHAGSAAQTGVIAALLAADGFTGSPDVLEVPAGGFMSTLGHDADPALLAADLGKKWETLEVGFKVYAACASAHTIVDAVLAMRRQGLTEGNLNNLKIHMSKSSVSNVGWPYRPGGTVAAQMNGYYAAAVTLLDGEAFVDQYTESRLDDPAILNVIKKIDIVHDPLLDVGGAATRHSVVVEARLSNGRSLQERVEQRRGSSHHPLTQAEVEAKFMRTAGAALGSSQVAELRDLVMSLERCNDIHRLSTLLAAAQ